MTATKAGSIAINSAHYRTLFSKNSKKIILINNAATLGEVKHFGKLHNTEIDKAFTVNVIAAAILMNNFIRQYQNHRAEKIIINVTSGAAHSAYDGWGIYCASKAAINMLSQVAVKEQESKNGNKIKVFAVAPGVVNTKMQTEIRNTEVGDFSRKEKFIELYEENELYDPNEVAKQFIRIIEKPELVKEVVSRIEL